MVKIQAQLIFVLGFAAFSAANSVASDADCPQICPLLLSPIFATDGSILKQFDNRCELKTSNCRQDRKALKPFVETLMDWCSTELVDNIYQKLGDLNFSKAECLKPCPMIYAPVCASNGKYRGLVSNRCELEWYNCVLGSAADHFRVLQANSCDEPLLQAEDQELIADY